MEVLIFSDKKNIEQCFAKILKTKGCSIKFCPVKEFSGTIKVSGENRILYIDITSLTESEKKKILNLIYKTKSLRIGVIDPDNSINDVAELFHHGVVDYIGKNIYKSGITFKRIEAAFNFRVIEDIVSECESRETLDIKTEYILSGNDWSLIKPGQEYTFCFMFIELDNFKEMKKNAGVERARMIMELFHKFIGQYVSSINGRIWIWTEYSGLILFPFDGCRCDAVLSSFKLMLNRALINETDLKMDYSYSYHIALHIGNTVYRERGETGTIVSDSINSIFHLGQKYAEDKKFYLTSDAARFIPDGLREFFVHAGEFEGRKILRMKNILE